MGHQSKEEHLAACPALRAVNWRMMNLYLIMCFALGGARHAPLKQRCDLMLQLGAVLPSRAAPVFCLAAIKLCFEERVGAGLQLCEDGQPSAIPGPSQLSAGAGRNTCVQQTEGLRRQSRQ